MKKNPENIQHTILYGFIAFYFIALVVNASKAAFGLERLAAHHWPLFCMTCLLGWTALTETEKARFLIKIKQLAKAQRRVVKKAASSLMAGTSRAVRCLSALFSRIDLKEA